MYTHLEHWIFLSVVMALSYVAWRAIFNSIAPLFRGTLSEGYAPLYRGALGKTPSHG
jgi:hypothetical protein